MHQKAEPVERLSGSGVATCDQSKKGCEIVERTRFQIQMKDLYTSKHDEGGTYK